MMTRVSTFFVGIALTASLWSQSVAQERSSVVTQPDVQNQTQLALKVKATLVGHEGQVFAVAFSPNGESLATASDSDDGTRLWNTAAGQLVAELDGTTPLFSPDGQVLLTIRKTTLTLWDAVNGKFKLSLTGHEGRITSASFSSDGSKLATGSEDGTVRLWDVATGRTTSTLIVWRVKKIPRYRIISRAMHVPVEVYAKFSPDQQSVLTTTYWEDSRAKLWDATGGSLRTELGGPMVKTIYYETKEAGVTAANFSQDGKFILTQSDGMVKLWETASHKAIEEFQGSFSVMKFSPDSKWLGLISTGKDVAFLNLETLKLQPISKVETDYLNQQAFSPDSRTCVIGSGYNHYHATLIDVLSGRVRANIPLVAKWGFDIISEYQKDVDVLSFHPSSNFLMGANHNAVRMWDVSSGALLWETIEGRDPARFSRDGNLLVTVGKDKKTVLLWTVESN